MCLSNRPPPPRMRSKPCERIGRERERREETESEPAQTYRPPSRFPGRTGSGCLSHAGCWQVFRFASTSAFAGFLLSIHRFPAPKSSCVSWIRSRLPLRVSPGVAPGSLLLSDNAQRTSTGHSLLRHPIFVNSDSGGHGAIRFHQHNVAYRRAKVASYRCRVLLPRFKPTLAITVLCGARR